MIHSFTTREHACKILTAAITETVNRPMVFDIYGGHISQENVPIGVTQCQDCGETVFRTFGNRSSLLVCPQCDDMMKLIVKADLVILDGVVLYRGVSSNMIHKIHHHYQVSTILDTHQGETIIFDLGKSIDPLAVPVSQYNCLRCSKKLFYYMGDDPHPAECPRCWSTNKTPAATVSLVIQDKQVVYRSEE